jgi:hypothetical protein
MNKTFFTASAFVLSFILLNAMLSAQDNSAEQNRDRLSVEQADKDGPANKGLTLDKKPTSRLPNGYGKVVDDKQREDIYKIQKEYNERIDFLKYRIELLTKERDIKIYSLLTPEQQEKVKNPAQKRSRSTETPKE